MAIDEKRQKIINIFISEANEIIEELDLQLINLEENMDDKDIINIIFRGVHTLKGNANSFGFSRLGAFVHHWEDLLDAYRSDDKTLSEETFELFLDSFNVLQEVFNMEMNGIDGVPEDYDNCLSKIKNELGVPESTQTNQTVSKQETTEEIQEQKAFQDDSTALVTTSANLFKDDYINEIKGFGDTIKNDILKALSDGHQFYRIILKFDSDLYFRGHNHNILIKVLSDISTIMKTYWNLSDTPVLKEYNPHTSYINSINVYLYTKTSIDEIEETFEFVADDHEVEIKLFEKNEIESYLQDNSDNNDKEDNIIDDITQEIEDIKEQDNTIEETVVEQKPEPIVQAPINVPKAPISDIAKDAKTIEDPVEPPTPMGSIANTQAQTKKVASSFIKIESQKVDELFDSIGELVIAGSYLYQSDSIRELNENDINQNLEALAKSTKLIQHKVMSLRMVPIKNTFNKMKRVVRDVSKKTSKDIDLVITGEDTEIDKTMVDDLADPLVHLVRNAIDHGIEDKATREKAGKDARGTVQLKAYHKGNNIVIEIKEDGAGINRDKILEKAISKGIVENDNGLSDKEIIEFIFHPGFSTAAEISDVSGRGVGLDVVKSSIEKLKGKINIDTEVGKGTSFQIILPLTLAIIDGMLISVDDDTFIVPTLNVIECFRPKDGEVMSVKQKGEFIDFRGEVLPILRLNKVLELSDEEKDVTESTLICIDHEKGKFIILVDELIGRQQVVVKTLGKFLSNIKEIAGGAILGNGEISLILNIEGLRNRLD
jgi:two-component system chemotaxis sensor kinase CheA